MKNRILKALEATKGPIQTWQIAMYMRCYNETPMVLRRLKSLEKEGKVCRHELSRKNSIFWCLKGRSK